MTTPIQGRSAAIMLGLESTHGTPVSRDLALRVNDVSGHIQEIDRAPLQSSQGPGTTHGGMPIATVDGAIRLSALSFTVPAYYNDDSLVLLYAAMGAVTDGGSAPSSWTHTFTLDGTLPSYTIETIEGEDAAGTTDAVVAAGCMCEELVWTIQAGTNQPSTIQTTWNCQKDAGDTTASTPTFGAITAPVMYHHLGDLAWNSITVDSEIIRTVTLTITNGLATDREGLGTQYRQEPCLAGERIVTMEVEMERHAADAIRASYTSAASSNLTITATLGSKTVAFTLHSARIMSFGRTVVIDGNNMQTVTFRGYATPGGTNGLAIVITNDVEHYDGS